MYKQKEGLKMTIAIIGAMEEEVTILRSKMTDTQTKTIAHVEFTQGMLNGKDVVLLKSGIGKVNVAITTTLLFEHYQVSAVINTGSAGGVHPDANVGDVVISSGVCYHDVDVTGFGYAMGQVPGSPAVYAPDETLISLCQEVLQASDQAFFTGIIGTGDSFVNRPDQIEAVTRQFNDVIAIEMEAAAVAQVCHQFNKPFVILRGLSDIAGKESQISFNEYLDLAAKQSSEMVTQLVGRMNA